MIENQEKQMIKTLVKQMIEALDQLEFAVGHFLTSPSTHENISRGNQESPSSSAVAVRRRRRKDVMHSKGANSRGTHSHVWAPISWPLKSALHSAKTGVDAWNEALLVWPPNHASACLVILDAVEILSQSPRLGFAQLAHTELWHHAIGQRNVTHYRQI